MSVYRIVAARVREGVPLVDGWTKTVRDAMRRFTEARSRTLRMHYMASAAFGITCVCNVTEGMFRTIAENIDESVPAGGEQYAEQLIRQMTLEIPGVRPAVLRRETARLLGELMDFREFVYDTYTFAITEERLKKACAVLERAVDLLRADLNGFAEFADAIDDAIDLAE